MATNIKIEQTGVSRSFFQDAYYKVLRMSWKNFIFLAGFFYLFLNLIFGLAYYFSPGEILNTRPDSLWDAFVFSFQTSSTVGYGYFLPQSDTAHAIVIIDTMVGIFYVAIITGLAFSKFARPNANIIFSENVILTKFDGIPTLMFRVANNRDTHIIDASVNVAAILPYESKEGHQMRRFHHLKLLSKTNPAFALSWTVMHQIDEKSPLHGLSLSQMKEKGMLIFTSITGMDHVLCQTIHANQRYTSEKLIEAKRFKDIVSVKDQYTYEINFEHFNSVEV